MKLLQLIWLIFVFTVFTSSLSHASGMTEGVTVQVSKMNEGKDGIRYHYTVKNRTDAQIMAVNIGFDHMLGVSELSERPVGWANLGDTEVEGISFPKNWSVNVMPTEESRFLEIDFERKKASPKKENVQKVINGFSILIKKSDKAYSSGHWRVLLSDGTFRIGTFKRSKSK